jgi:hypothetical protein
MPERPENPPEKRPEIKYRPGRPQIEAVCEALRTAHGLVEPAARILGMDGSNLRKYVRHHARCQVVQREARSKVSDLAEQKLYSLIQAGDWRAISFWLLTMCKDRGYLLPKDAAIGDSTTNVQIGSVTINPIESGRFLTESPVALEGREPSSVVPLRVIEGDKLN